MAQSNPASDGLPLQRWVPRTPLSYNTMGVAYAYPFPCKAASQTRVWSSAGGWTWLDLLDLLDFRNQALQLVGANEELMIEVGFFGGSQIRVVLYCVQTVDLFEHLIIFVEPDLLGLSLGFVPWLMKYHSI